MNATLKVFLINSLKQAVNAILTDTALSIRFKDTFHTHSLQGWEHLGEAALIVIGMREALVWGPKILSWSQHLLPDPGPTPKL